MPDTDSFLATVVKGGSVLFLGLVFELGISFVAKLVIARYLGPVRYGGVSLGLTTMTLTSTLVLGGLYAGIGRHLPRYDDPSDRRGVLVSGFQIGVPLAIGGGVVLLTFAPWVARNVYHDAALTPIIEVFALAVPAGAFLRLAIGAVQGLQRSLPKVYIENITLPITRFAGIAVVVLVGAGALGVAWAYLASYTLAALICGYYVVRRTPLLSRDVGYTPMHRELLVFSLPLAISGVMSFVFAQSDTILLGYYTATGDVGVYNVIYPIAQLLAVGLSSVEFVFMPVLSELHSEGAIPDMAQLYRTVTKWIFVATLPLFLVFALFPTMTIRITFGRAYSPGAAALSVLAIAFFTHAILGLASNVLTSIGKTRYIMYDTALAALVNLVLNVVLIPRYSFFGAALATTISYALLNVTYTYQLYRETGIHPIAPSLVVPGLIGGATVTAIYLVTTWFFVVSIPVLLVMFVVFMAVYGLAVLRFGIEAEEVMLVLRFEDRFDVDLGPLKVFANYLIGS